MRRTPLLALAFLATLLFVACGGSGAPMADPDDEAPPPAPTEAPGASDTPGDDAGTGDGDEPEGSDGPSDDADADQELAAQTPKVYFISTDW